MSRREAKAATSPRENVTARQLVRNSWLLMRTGWRIDRGQMIRQVTFTALRGVVGGVSMVMLIPIVNSVASAEGASLVIPRFGRVGLGDTPLWLLLAIFVVLTALTALMARSATINAAKLQPIVTDHLRQETFDAILSANWLFVVSMRRSDIIDAVTSGAGRCGNAFNQLLVSASNLVLLLAMSIIALVLAPGLALLALLGVVALLAVRLLATRSTADVGGRTGRSNRQLQAVMQDSMDSMRLVRAHDAAGVWRGRLSSAFEGSRDAQLAQVAHQATITATSAVVLSSAAALLVLIAVAMAVPTASIALILVLMARIARYAQALGMSFTQLAGSLPAVGELYDLQVAANAAAEVPAGAVSQRDDDDLATADPLVEFRQVSFAYPSSTNGVTDLSFAVPAGKITVLTGHSGAGKSTSADLALGLLQPASGEILVGGGALTPPDLPWWRRHVAYVPQETVLLPDTLRENLIWSVGRDISDDECWEALDRAAAGFARALPRGLDAQLGDSGIRLSGGERQRIAIARALLRRPRLLVLDEATSNLDVAAESSILDLMSSLTPSMTLLVIAHRPSTVEAADHVVRLKEGRVC